MKTTYRAVYCDSTEPLVHDDCDLVTTQPDEDEWKVDWFGHYLCPPCQAVAEFDGDVS